MKKIVPFILLSLAVVLTTGGYFFHKAHLVAYKEEFKAYIKHNSKQISTTQLTINRNELFVNTKQLIWQDENKEVYYKGNLYDVVSFRAHNGKIVLALLSDEKEQKLKEEFASIYHSDSFEKNNNKPIKLLKQFLALKYFSPTTVRFNKFNYDASAKPIACGNYQKTDGFIARETPPPDVI